MWLLSDIPMRYVVGSGRLILLELMARPLLWAHGGFLLLRLQTFFVVISLLRGLVE